ncbi:MAG: sigma-54-dependent transcriptional regulator [Nitrospirota bacterium]
MKQAKAKKTLLVIDDDRVFGEAIRDYLSSDLVEVLIANKAADGLTLCSLRKIDVVVLDQQLPDGEGHALCPDILRYNDQTKIIFSTAFPSFENAVKAIRFGAHDYLSKPYDLEELALAVRQAFRTLELEQVEQVQNYQRTREKDAAVIIGGEGIADVLQLVEIAAMSDSPVLITGETGTGKSLIAKAIHFRGRPNNAPFVSINCASLPENLIEAELFGFEKGAFTGAVAAKKGLFEMAEGGTLFLDEIGEMPIHLQSKLLSALEDRMIRRLGGITAKPINVRIIAATSVELEATLGKNFRSDLFYRLSVVRIHIPPLRDRRGDIPVLCGHLLKTITNNPVEVSENDMAQLMKYDWPGNIRELKNILERAVFVQSGAVLEPSLLLEKRAPGPANCTFPVASGTTIKTLDECEKEIITAALAQLNGNLSQTAKALAISLSTLKRKIREYQIP